MMPFNSLDVASFIATVCNEQGFHYNNTKIQKLLYCCYGGVLAVYNQRLCDEYPRAWQYGPVFPRVFNFISKRKGTLESRITDFYLDEELDSFLRKIIKVFGKYNAVPLSEWTHKDGSPWDKVVNGIDGGGLNNFIPDDIIRDYFREHVIKDGMNA